MNKAEIVNRIKITGRTVNGWARYRGHNEQTVHAFLNGRMRPGTYAWKAISADLITDGYLKEDEAA